MEEGKEAVSNNNERAQYHLLVVRLDREGQLRNSKPCSECLEFLRRFGHIDKIFYSTDDGRLAVEKLDEMNSDHFTNGCRALQRMV